MTNEHDHPPLPEDQRNSTVAVYSDLDQAEDADVQRARDLLADTHAESIETHVAEPEPVA